MAASVLFFLVFAFLSYAVEPDVVKPADCPCGYWDPGSREVFTDATIVYFNESTALPLDDFAVESYEHKYEKDWNAVYRQGADPANARIVISSCSNSPLLSCPSNTLELAVLPPTSDHLVYGGGLRTLRRDIQYGSFTSLVRSPPQGAGGSAVSILVEYNYTQSIAMSLQNTDNPDNAWVSMLMHNEVATPNLGVRYSTLSDPSLANHTSSPWNWIEIRVDWSKERTIYYIGGVKGRTVMAGEESQYPSTPAPVSLKHWSIGDTYQTQGPPVNRSIASMGWTRMFYNSSLMTKDGHLEFDARCDSVQLCSIDNMALRGSSSFPPDATLVWEQAMPQNPLRVVAAILIAIFMSMTLLLLFNTYLRRLKPKTPAAMPEPIPRPNTDSRLLAENQAVADDKATAAFDFPESQSVVESTISFLFEKGNRLHSGEDPNLAGTMDASAVELNDETSTNHFGILTSPAAWRDGPEIRESLPQAAINRNIQERGETFANLSCYKLQDGAHDHEAWSGTATPYEEDTYIPRPFSSISSIKVAAKAKGAQHKKADTSGSTITTSIKQEEDCAKRPDEKGFVGDIIELYSQQRVDHLAGLNVIAALIVTQIHFYLTFLPAVIEPFAPAHYASETIAHAVISNYLFNISWLGPFLTIASHFLVASYLREGDLRKIAEKVVVRVPRLMIPVTVIAALEYFFIECGAINWLEMIPSVTWSTWPYAVRYSNFGQFLSEILELLYLIPNAAPKITDNFCTGVLWTIPVQIQGSWQALLSAIVVYEIKTPWKRACYYTFCILSSWYAECWGSFFWMGVLLTDLEITYHYKRRISSRPWLHRSAMFVCFVLAFMGLSLDMISERTGTAIAANEHGIHPDHATGLPIAKTLNAGYPPYYNPKLAGLIFTVGLHALTDLSPLMQRLLSIKPLLMLFPHTFTIYLIHGFILWSLGTWICIQLAIGGMPYSVNMLTVAISCYCVILISLPLLTPATELPAKNIGATIWEAAWQRSPPRRPTLFPYSKALLLARNVSLPADYVVVPAAPPPLQIPQLPVLSRKRNRVVRLDGERGISVIMEECDEFGDGVVDTLDRINPKAQASSWVGGHRSEEDYGAGKQL